MQPNRRYLPRIADALLREALEDSGAVLVEGPKWCGKTRLCEQAAASCLYLHDPDKGPGYIEMAGIRPSRLLEGPTPRLIDEWQDAPMLWNAVRFVVDKRGGTGHFLLTGSTVPRDELPGESKRHSGTGRIARLKMLPMSLWDSGESSGEVSVSALFEGCGDIEGKARVDVEGLANAICRGGWPEAVVAGGPRSMRRAPNYLDTLVEDDLQRMEGVPRNPQRCRAVLRSLARNVSTLASATTIMDDMAAEGDGMSDKTLADYLNALRRLFVIRDQPAWSPRLRSRAAMRTSAKRQFADPSIAAAALSATPGRLLDDPRTFGFFFESLAVRDLRAYCAPLGGDILHYRDETGLECDAIIQLHDGRWAAVEVKLGKSRIDEAAEHLLALTAKIDAARTGAPVFLLVLTGTDFAYRRADGVFVCPLAALRP